MWAVAGAAFAMSWVSPTAAQGDVSIPVPVIAALLEEHCLECHDEDTQGGGLRLDTLGWGLDDPPAFAVWVKVHDKLSAGVMPPPADRDAPPDEERAPFLEMLEESLHAADQSRQATEGRTMLRRLNRTQFENALRDLLAVPDLKVRKTLPEDAVAGGFNTVGKALDLSSIHIERYLAAADHALDMAIISGTKPKTQKARLSLLDQRHLYNQPNRPSFKRGDELVMLSREYGLFRGGLEKFPAPLAGSYRISIQARVYQSKQAVTMVVIAGQGFKPNRITKSHLLGYFDVAPGRRQTIELTAKLEQGDCLRVFPMLPVTRFPRKGDEKSRYKVPGLAVGAIDIQGPLVEQWPPASHVALFGKLAMKSPAVAKNPRKYADFVVTQFVNRAFRRPATDQEIKPYLALADQELDHGSTFNDAMHVALKAVLVAPEFLFFRENTGLLSEHAVASRLSFFLWNSIPDDELIDLADKGILTDPATLHRQVERLLDDPKSERFLLDFVSQWLDMDQIDFTLPDSVLYPEFDALLQHSMQRETELFFTELVNRDLGVSHLVASDFSFLNKRLADHYGIPGVKGVKMHPVSLPVNSHRGGFLTQASVMKVTANGTTTTPVLRGVWVLENILGRTLGQPPANVGSLDDPDIRGATTIRKQVEKHRANPVCASCHDKIDPIGFALENFDVIGGWRDHYRKPGRRSKGNRTNAGLNNRIRYQDGAAVEAEGRMLGGETFADIDELRSLLLRDEETLARGLAAKLLVYATGAQPSFADRRRIAEIVDRVREKDYGVRSLIHEIVVSEAFLRK